ncbi:MAG: hypothetical protein JXC33_05335, partial [Deltaproteobacteria bacterium]|nr:hypothetical protein [Deltaproteobacteria bacterium]
MKKSLPVLLTCAVVIVVIACGYKIMTPRSHLKQDIHIMAGSEHFASTVGDLEKTIQTIHSNIDADKFYPELDIFNPYDGTLFPRDMASPTFVWEDWQKGSSLWLVSIHFAHNDHAWYVLTDWKQWTPDKATWEMIKENSLERKACVTITGIDRDNSYEIVTRSGITFTTSRDEVGAPIFYVQMPLPFARA